MFSNSEHYNLVLMYEIEGEMDFHDPEPARAEENKWYIIKKCQANLFLKSLKCFKLDCSF